MIVPIDLKSKIRTVPNWPKPGVMFRDITTLLKDNQCFNHIINLFYERYKTKKIDSIAAIESRGFIIGSALAYKLGLGFVPIRKKGKLPAETEAEEYTLEYGTDKIEIHKDAISSGANILLVDDLVATAGTLVAAINLIEKLGGKVIECVVIIELPDLHGREKIEAKGHKLFSLVQFEGE